MNKVFCTIKQYCSASVLSAFLTVSVLSTSNESSSLLAQSVVQVGFQPLEIVPQSSIIHVFCGGIDNNFNGVIEPDSNDLPAQWFILDAISLQVLNRVNFSQSFPIFPFHGSYKNDNIVIPFQNGSFNLYDSSGNFRTTITREMLGFGFGAIGGVDEAEGKYAFTIRTSFDKPGKVFLSSLTSPADTVSVGINPSQVLFYTLSSGNKGLAVLSEGTFSATDAKLHLFPQQNSLENPVVLEVGGTANSMKQKGDSLFVVANSSHQVFVIDLTTSKIVKTISTGTTGYNGPRSCSITGDRLFVSTYNGDIREFSISSGSLQRTLDAAGKVEGVAIWENGVNSKLLAANIMDASYAYLRTLSVWNFSSLVSVNEDEVSHQLASSAVVIPQPANGHCTVDLPNTNTIYSVSLYSIESQRLEVPVQVVQNGSSHRISLESASLQSGVYFLRVETDTGTKNIRFVVAR